MGSALPLTPAEAVFVRPRLREGARHRRTRTTPVTAMRAALDPSRCSGADEPGHPRRRRCLGVSLLAMALVALMAYLTRKLTAVVVVDLLMILRFDLATK